MTTRQLIAPIESTVFAAGRLSPSIVLSLLILFIAPVPSVAEIGLDKDGNLVEFTYATMSDGVRIALALGYPRGFDPQDQTQKWPAILEMSGYPAAAQPAAHEHYEGLYVTVRALGTLPSKHPSPMAATPCPVDAPPRNPMPAPRPRGPGDRRS